MDEVLSPRGFHAFTSLWFFAIFNGQSPEEMREFISVGTAPEDRYECGATGPLPIKGPTRHEDWQLPVRERTWK